MVASMIILFQIGTFQRMFCNRMLLFSKLFQMAVRSIRPLFGMILEHEQQVQMNVQSVLKCCISRNLGISLVMAIFGDLDVMFMALLQR